MVSLTYYNFEESINDSLQCIKGTQQKTVDKSCVGLQKFAGFCADSDNLNVIAQISSKNNKGRKDKRFQPFRTTICPWTKCTSGGDLAKVPHDIIFLNTNNAHTSRTTKKLESASFIVKAKEMKDFFKLTEDSVIQGFLQMDSCKRIADKYLIAMVFAYFKRADYTIKDYTRLNFFLGLYLANDVEEDEEEIKYEIFPWVLGKNWRSKYSTFLKMRDELLKRIGFKAIISRRCCDEIMAIEPDNKLWKRDRQIHHGGAVRNYMKDPCDDGFPRGPNVSPLYCAECDAPDSQCNSESPASTSWFISSRDSSPDKRELKRVGPKVQDDIWPSVEE